MNGSKRIKEINWIKRDELKYDQCIFDDRIIIHGTFWKADFVTCYFLLVCADSRVNLMIGCHNKSFAKLLS